MSKLTCVGCGAEITNPEVNSDLCWGCAHGITHVAPPATYNLNFSERNKLAAEFATWAKLNNVLSCPAGVIAYLQTNGLLDTIACHSFLKKGEF